MLKKLDGKMISYYDQDYQSYVYLGCLKEDAQTATAAGRQPFNPDKIKGCINAVGPNSYKIKLKNLIGPGPPT